MEILGHPIKEIKALFARELISPEISEDEATIKNKANDDQPISEEIYYVPFIPWRSNEVIIILYLLKYSKIKNIFFFNFIRLSKCVILLMIKLRLNNNAK